MKSHYKSLFELTGKTAIVTGAVGILGQGFCRGLAEFGAQVVVVDLDADRFHFPDVAVDDLEHFRHRHGDRLAGEVGRRTPGSILK